MEWILAFAISAAINVWGFFELGQTKAERDTARIIAEGCAPKPDKHKRAVAHANARAKREDRTREITERSETTVHNALASDSQSCLIAPVGSIGRILWDESTRVVEELHGLQP